MMWVTWGLEVGVGDLGSKHPCRRGLRGGRFPRPRRFQALGRCS
ncbi:hypothetical protein [Ornithinimicrobium kibberense]